MAKSCQPQATQFDFLALKSDLCLREIAEFGPAGRAAGEFLMPFLASTNGAERAYGILTLGFIDYAPASAHITEALDAKDWREVYAAVWAAGWLGDHDAVSKLGDHDAVSKLDRLQSGYWLAELRSDAAHVSRELRSPKGQVDRGAWEVMDQGFRRDPTWVITGGYRGKQISCADKMWEWQGEKFKIQHSRDRDAGAHSLRLWNSNIGGELVGSDHGEWGGELTWIPGQGAPEVLDRDNVHGLDYDNDGAIVLFGLAHMGFNYGYALKVSRNADGSWTQTQIARLPGEPQGWTGLKSDRVAVLTAGRVVVFSSKEGILGVASCVFK
jgi:hypothetical protein